MKDSAPDELMYFSIAGEIGSATHLGHQKLITYSNLKKTDKGISLEKQSNNIQLKVILYTCLYYSLLYV